MFLLGAVSPDSSKYTTSCSISPPASTTAPPHPPPKNAAHMLALALAESAQQVSIQCQSQSSEPSSPVTPLQSQNASNNQESPYALVQTSSEEELGRGSSPPPYITDPTVAPTSSFSATSSLAVKPQPLEFPSMITKLPDSAKTPTVSPDTQPETDSTQTDIPINKGAPLPISINGASPTRKSPERQQTVTAQIPVNTSSWGNTPANTLSGSCKDSGLLLQPVSEVSHFKGSRKEYPLRL